MGKIKQKKKEKKIEKLIFNFFKSASLGVGNTEHGESAPRKSIGHQRTFKKENDKDKLLNKLKGKKMKLFFFFFFFFFFFIYRSL